MRDKKVYGDNKVKTTANYCPQITNACKTWEIRHKTVAGGGNCNFYSEFYYRGSAVSCVNGEQYAFNIFQGSETRNCPQGKWYRGNCDGGSSGNPDNAIVAWNCIEQAIPNQCSNPRTKVVYEDTYQLP